MKRLYLILAAIAVIASCASEPIKSDIIWYPVDNEEGVYISIYGEKHRTPQHSKWRSHRRARYSGMDPSWPFDPTENHDPSFFHNINQRRPLITIPPTPKVPHSFQNQQLPFNRPQGQPNQNDNYRDVLNEVFGNNKFVSVSEYPGSRPGISNQWGDTAFTNNQWSGNPVFENNNQWSRPGFSTTRSPWEQTNQWGSTTTSRPTESEWINNNRPKNPGGSKRPTNQSDKLIFPDEDLETTTASLNLVPMDPTTLSPCERLCPVTPEFNPVCGSDGASYNNAGRLKCAQSCGKDVKLSHYGTCGRTPFITPLVSKNPRRRKNNVKFSEFW